MYIHNRKHSDFEVLYNELEAWRVKEVGKAKNNPHLPMEDKKYVYEEILRKVITSGRRGGERDPLH